MQLLSSLVLLLLVGSLPTALASTCTSYDGNIALKNPRVTVGSDGSLTLTGKVKFASTSSDYCQVKAHVSGLGQGGDLDGIDLCQDLTCSDGSSGAPCTSWTEMAVDLGMKVPEQFAQYVPSGFSIKANAIIYQQGQPVATCTVGVRSASASFVSLGAVAVLLGLGGGLVARRRRRRIALLEEAEGDAAGKDDGNGPSSSFVEMADGRGDGGGAVLA